ncbi:glycosyltransferase [Vineibacter terrae]|uniref:Glycosyltransferase n=1 Tax=Vineibacter terrae TaxID=2586908 RepID=A0A5C8PJV8_9HYPH|nr:TIGR04283 family arsenosugar biosynthesis glycosyltransferase [Vineibacter terrae]TXL73686.1 glycosyltransferase [Vineibacter terrae]
MLTIVMPVLDEAATVVDALRRLQDLRARGCAVIVVDGGSHDATADLARPLADRVAVAPRGRAVQMNAGAALAQGDALLFLHADTLLPPDADRCIADALAGGADWGRFDVRIDGAHPMLAVVGWSMNLRSRLTAIATGDQAMFVRRDVFTAVGGFPDIPLMEDIALSRTLKRRGRPACLRPRVTTSGRRWQKHGVLPTILLMWRLRLAYFLGADPGELAVRYGYRPARR